MIEFGLRLKKLRKEQNLRQTDLAEKLNLSRTTIANYEQNIRFPNQEALCNLADQFDVSLDYLLGRTDIRNNTDLTLFRKSHAVMLLINPTNGDIVDCSTAAESFYGYTRKELLAMKISSINCHPQPLIESKMEKAIAKKQNLFHFQHRLSNGQIKDVEVYSGPIKLNNQIFLYSIIHDITEHKKMKDILTKTFETLVPTLINYKMPYKINHEKRVAQLASAIARKINLSANQIWEIRVAAITHDVGKVNVPIEILSKPSKLKDVEYQLIKEHVNDGYRMLKEIDLEDSILQIVHQHHERLDGSGYPNGLKEDDIILGAKILGIADVVEAMSSSRPHRQALGIDLALKEISRYSGIKYDPLIVKACIDIFKNDKFKFAI